MQVIKMRLVIIGSIMCDISTHLGSWGAAVLEPGQKCLLHCSRQHSHIHTLRNCITGQTFCVGRILFFGSRQTRLHQEYLRRGIWNLLTKFTYQSHWLPVRRRGACWGRVTIYTEALNCRFYFLLSPSSRNGGTPICRYAPVNRPSFLQWFISHLTKCLLFFTTLYTQWTTHSEPRVMLIQSKLP